MSLWEAITSTMLSYGSSPIERAVQTAIRQKYNLEDVEFLAEMFGVPIGKLEKKLKERK
jgi:hypothetical protein